jgi:hypothetical protein
VTVTVVRPNKEKVTIATSMNTTVETFILQFVMTVAGGRDRGGADGPHQVLALRGHAGPAVGQHDQVGIYVTPEEVREGMNKVYELYRVRGAPKPASRVQKEHGQARDKSILAKVKLDQIMLRRMRTPWPRSSSTRPS